MQDEAKEGKEKRVRLVTAEEEAAGSVDIGRVVLPLPGATSAGLGSMVIDQAGRPLTYPQTNNTPVTPSGINVQYPGHGTGDLYKQVFAERGLPMESLKNASQGDYTLGGDYRKLVRPGPCRSRLL